MGKGRAPCCDKSKVKRGPWSPEEDLRLISFIQKHGHNNWRSLPKQAGLVRCGKSCRLRWINYLRPDVKRGNFTEEEEQTIIKLHRALGNKWSKIASYLPGRTDNEIKNVWNTHLKKRKFLECSSASDDQLSKQESSITSSSSSSSSSLKTPQVVLDDDDHFNAQGPQFVTSMAENNTNEQDSENPPTSLCSSESTPISNSDTLEKEVVEIPFEADHDFWNLLDDDNIGGSLQSDDQVQQHQKLVHQDAERRKWFYELEKELELEPQEFDMEMMKTTGSDPDIWNLA